MEQSAWLGFFDRPRRVAECLDRDEGTRRGDTQQLQAPAQALAPEVARDDDQIDIAPGMRHALRPRPEQGDALGADAKPPQLAAERAYFPAREGCFRRDRKSTRLNSSHEWISY